MLSRIKTSAQEKNETHKSKTLTEIDFSRHNRDEIDREFKMLKQIDQNP